MDEQKPVVSEDEQKEDKVKSESENKEPPMNAQEEWYELLKTAFIAVLLALIIRTFLFEPFHIPSSSMRPTLEIGDYLFVYKPSYGFSKYSFPFGVSPISSGRVFYKEPQRGDVVVFKLPKNTRIDYIKRIIGLPGDHIQVKQGRLYINGEMIEREFVGEETVEENYSDHLIKKYIETLPNGVKHYIYEEGDNRVLDNTVEFVVPENNYFMMGDNRDHSQDSRVQSEVGFVPLENFVGKAEWLFFSTNGTARVYEFWKWPETIRYDRLFKLIHAQPEDNENE